MTTLSGFDADTLLTEAQMTRVMSAGYSAMGVYFTKSAIFPGMSAFIGLCAKHGFRMWLIDEGMGNAAVFAHGSAGGRIDGQRAAGIAKRLGVPTGTPIYFAIDYAAGEADIPNISAYYAGYKEGCVGYKVGMYADGLIASAVPTDVGDYVPGASGWPGTAEYLKSGKVALIQHPPAAFFGMDADPVEIIDESVLWSPSAVAAPVVATTPIIPISVALFSPPSVIAWQQHLGITADGIYGPETAAAIEHYYVMGGRA